MLTSRWVGLGVNVTLISWDSSVVVFNIMISVGVSSYDGVSSRAGVRSEYRAV